MGFINGGIQILKSRKQVRRQKTSRSTLCSRVTGWKTTYTRKMG